MKKVFVNNDLKGYYDIFIDLWIQLGCERYAKNNYSIFSEMINTTVKGAVDITAKNTVEYIYFYINNKYNERKYVVEYNQKENVFNRVVVRDFCGNVLKDLYMTN